MIRVLLADDHEIVRHGLKLLIDNQKDMEVVGEVGTGRAAVERARALEPTVVVLDVSHSASTELLAAIRAVTEGRRYLDAALTDRVTGAFLAAHTAVASRRRISDREGEVLRLIAIGYSNKEWLHDA